MNQATRPSDRHIIWSNRSLDVDDWREDYKEFLEANELDDDPNDEQALYEWMVETNYDYLFDERVNLNVQLALKTILPSKYEVIDSPPPYGKDYNDFLCFRLGIHRNKTKERTNER